MSAVIIEQRVAAPKAQREVGIDPVEISGLLRIALIGHGYAKPQLTQVTKQTPSEAIRSCRFTSAPKLGKERVLHAKPLPFAAGPARLAGLIRGSGMKLYRVNKLAKIGGVVLKKKHILARSDAQAVQQAEDSDDCPICDVLHNGEKVGQVL